jgi:Histidine kinase
MKATISPIKQLPTSGQLNDIGFRVILIPAIGITIPLVTGMIPHGTLSNWEIKFSYLYTIAIAWVIWHGNRYLLFTLRSYFNWFNHPMRKIGALLLVIPFFTVPISVLLLSGWYHIFQKGVVDWTVVIQSTLIILIAVMFIVHVYETVFLVKESESEMLRNSQLERARAEAALDALKNQIDPHFIFNSLNTLSHLIESSPVKARQFNDAMAEVYRYILQNKGRDLVQLREEMVFLNNYFALLKIRFGENIRLDQAIPDNALDEYILPPISLQLLMENAIKHNEFSRQNVLVITLQLKENMLVFSNNITKKRLDRGSNGIGLTNLQERYGIVTGKEISIAEENNAFTVALPLLKLN